VPDPEIRLPEQDSVPNGAVVAVCVDGRHRFSKVSRVSITLTSGHGIEGDAHYGPFVRHRYLARRNPKAPNLRQVHLVPSELFDALRTSGFEVRPGDLGENITTVGLDLERLPLGTLLRLGASATLELTGLRTPRVLIDRFKSGLKNRLQGRPVATLQGRRHGDRNGGRRGLAWGPDPGGPSCASPSGPATALS
jgi:hypothetical protein